jgi:hypothetical protein
VDVDEERERERGDSNVPMKRPVPMLEHTNDDEKIS